jgi:hypothetical protein
MVPSERLRRTSVRPTEEGPGELIENDDQTSIPIEAGLVGRRGWFVQEPQRARRGRQRATQPHFPYKPVGGTRRREWVRFDRRPHDRWFRAALWSESPRCADRSRL